MLGSDFGPNDRTVTPYRPETVYGLHVTENSVHDLVPATAEVVRLVEYLELMCAIWKPKED